MELEVGRAKIRVVKASKHSLREIEILAICCQYLVESGDHGGLELRQELVNLVHVQSEVSPRLNWFRIVGIWGWRFWLAEAGLCHSQSTDRLAGDGQSDVALR